ncbi:GntR family transcriptional regulator [Solicola sp. PLA-1-18]|uniref:GntR family transcriptional regulator n=1 Tax=Solicola sp. PLA-1-18 TaxID=3380532 RepID=UPI003B7E7717
MDSTAPSRFDLTGASGRIEIAMDIWVDTRSPTPHYEQIRSQVSQLVMTGALPPGTRLPPIRRLAGHLGLSNGAVARAYKELEREGTVATKGKAGTTVLGQEKPTHSASHNRDRSTALMNAATQYAVKAHQLGYRTDEAIAALETVTTSPLSPPKRA